MDKNHNRLIFFLISASYFVTGILYIIYLHFIVKNQTPLILKFACYTPLLFSFIIIFLPGFKLLIVKTILCFFISITPVFYNMYNMHFKINMKIFTINFQYLYLIILPSAFLLAALLNLYRAPDFYKKIIVVTSIIGILSLFYPFRVFNKTMNLIDIMLLSPFTFLLISMYLLILTSLIILSGISKLRFLKIPGLILATYIPAFIFISARVFYKNMTFINKIIYTGDIINYITSIYTFMLFSQFLLIYFDKIKKHENLV